MNRAWMSATALALCCLCGSLSADERGRIGRAYDAQSGALIYEERHQETFAAATLVADTVRYVDPRGRAFAAKQVSFRSNPYLPDFQLVNDDTGHLEGLRHLGQGWIEVRCREGAGDALRAARIPTPENSIADAGFDRFIEKYWDRLLDGEPLVRQFLVPCRLEFLGFRIRRDDDDSDARRVSFAMDIDSALLRLVVPGIRVDYDRGTRRLLSYRGMSNLRDERGDNLAVRIDFAEVVRTSLARATRAHRRADE